MTTPYFRSELVAASKAAVDRYGVGLSSVRFICGTQDLHKKLELELAQFHRTDDAILYSSCFDANAGIFEAILCEDDLILSDALNHASIIDGIRLSKAKRARYAHSDMDGMDGEFAKLDRICSLAEQYGAMVFVDDCHATGFIGKSGRGTSEYFGVEDRVDIINSTLGKALGGGYTAASKDIVTLLRQKSRPYLFSNTLAPPVAASALAALELILANPMLPTKLLSNTRLFRRLMASAGFSLMGDADHPIAPVLVGDASVAAKMADHLLDLGIYVISFSYPVVPKGKARLRVQLSAEHTEEQINKAVGAFRTTATKFGLLK